MLLDTAALPNPCALTLLSKLSLLREFDVELFLTDFNDLSLFVEL
jgi:hypothetical protein